MATKNCANGPKLVLKDFCEKSFVRNDRLPLVNISLWSSTLPPWRVPYVHKNLSSAPLLAFLATKINKEQQSHQKTFFMKDTSTMIGTHN